MKLQTLVASRLFSSGNVGLVLAAACLGGFVSPAQALLVINAGNQNYRFMDNNLGPINTAPDNPIFIGKSYDLSGIAVSAKDGLGNPWFGGAMMISPHYFVTATHIAGHGSLNFRTQDGRMITKTVAGGKAMSTYWSDGSYAGTADLYIGLLAGDGITADDHVAYYPVIMQPDNTSTYTSVKWKWYNGKDMLVYSMNGGNAVGLNKIKYITNYQLGGYTTGVAFDYVGTPDAYHANYDNMAGLNGESGSPWGIIWNGQFTAGGAHSAYYAPRLGDSSVNPTDNYTSVSSFLPYYVDQINAYMHESYPNENVTIQSIPEPSGLALLIGGCVLLMRPKRYKMA